MQELSSGDRFEGYRIVRILGAGGMGDVYEAVHEVSDQKVALKCLKVRHSSKEDARARMKMEAVVLSEVQHANLVRVYDGGVTKTGILWFAMERLYGETLRELLYRSGALPAAEALYYASEVADGVDAVHAVNVVHRDLKPENIFITHQKQVKVLDLGTGKFTGYGLDSTDRMRIVGTTAYMAPEQIKGLSVDARADVYSLGLVVYEMLTGRHALLSALGGELPDDMERLALMQLQSKPVALNEILPDLPIYVASTVARAIVKKREERFPSMSELARELRACRKRLIAEHPRGGGMARPRLAEDLRQKLGARLPEGAPLRPRLPDAHPFDGHGRPVAADGPTLPAIAARDGAPPIIRVVDASDSEGTTDPRSRPAVAGNRAQATELISQSSGLSHMGECGPDDELSLSRYGVRVCTTNTNPLGIAALAETPVPFDAPGPPSEKQTVASSLACRGRASLSAPTQVWRWGMTLVLGAVIGLPPALLGIRWIRHQRSSVQAAEGGMARSSVAMGKSSGMSSVRSRPEPMASTSVRWEESSLPPVAELSPSTTASADSIRPAVAEPLPAAIPSEESIRPIAEELAPVLSAESSDLEVLPPTHPELVKPAHQAAESMNAEPLKAGGPPGAGAALARARHAAVREGTSRESGKPVTPSESTSALVSPDWSGIHPPQNRH